MADTAIVLKHLQDAGLDPTPKLPYTAINGHKLADGLGLDRRALAYLDSATNNLIATDNLPFLINAPGRYALIATSSAIVNTGAPTFFNKSATITGDALTALNTVGAVMRVTASGVMTTAASSPGGVTGAGIYLASGTKTLANTPGATPLPSSLAAQWSMIAWMTTRSTGGSATVAPAGMFSIPGIHAYNNASATMTMGLTASFDVQAAWAWETADPSNSVTLTQLIIEIFLAGSTVS